MYFISYLCIRLIGLPISFLPFRAIHRLGNWLGSLMFYLHRPFRKKTLTNLAIAKTLHLTESQRTRVAKESFQTLMINCLEFFRLQRKKNKMEEIATWGVPREAGLTMLQQGQGIIFLTGHQANWEIPFLLMTQFHPGIAIGRPIKNKWLYNWVLSIREMHKGKIIMPKKAMAAGYQALKEGQFLGIVGDQALPESSYSYPLFGTRAWTTTAPALLAYRTGCPIVTVMVRRVDDHYHIWGSPLLWPDMALPVKEAVPKLMDQAMGYLEESIKACPGQWLWQHDRWKQSGVDHVKRKFRFGFILVVLPKEIESYLPLISLLQKIYPRNFIAFFIPKGAEEHFSTHSKDHEVHPYEKEEDLFKNDYRYQIVFDFYDLKTLRSHYLRLGAFQALNEEKIYKEAKKELKNAPPDLATALKYALCKPDCIAKLFKNA